MPRPLTERPISEHLQIIYRLQRQLELSQKKIGPARWKRIREHLSELLRELQDAEAGKR